VTDLELRLRELGSFVELPPERELGSAVRSRIADVRPSRRRRGLVLALALVVLAVAIAFVVPPARSTILRWLGIGSARVEFVDRLPDVHPRRHIDLGPSTSLDEARRRVSYHVLTSSLLGSPDEVHVRGDQIAFVYRDKAVLMQTQGSLFTKEVGSSTHVQQLRIGGRPAVWITGAPHFFGYIGGENGRNVRPIDLYLAGNTLLWQRGDLTLRVEGKLTLDQALRIARSLE
jgi:hypothetical protein